MVVNAFSEVQLSNVFSALAHPVRRKILSLLKTGEATVTELAEPFDMTLPAITKHLKVLEKAELIDREQVAQIRYSHLNAKTLKGAKDWLMEYEEFWRKRFDRLESYVSNQNKEEEN